MADDWLIRTMPKSSSIRKIAKLANVSPMTVSYALRNSVLVAEETKARVMKIAEREGYKANPLVSSLMSQLKYEKRSGTYGTLGFINSYPNRREWMKGKIRPRFFAGVTARAEEWGYNVEEYYIKAPGMTAAKLSRILKKRQIQGVIVGALPIMRGHLSLRWEWFASIAHGYSLYKPNLHRVSSNHIVSMLITLRKLKKHGYKRPGFVSMIGAEARHSTIFSSIYTHNANLMFRQALPILLAKDPQDPLIKKWIAENKPDVIIALSKYVLDYLREAKIRIPEDIGFVSMTTDPTWDISGIDPKFESIGAFAVDLVMSQIERNTRGIPQDPINLMVEGDWVQGKTVRDQS